MPKVVHFRDAPKDHPDFVYCGRPSKWGNPFKSGVDGTRPEVIEKFRIYLENHPNLKSDAKKELRGKHLVCWCSPKSCHCDVLLEVANSSDLLEFT